MAAWREARRNLDERIAEATCPDRGHLGAIEEARNRVSNAAAKVRRHCRGGDMGELYLGAAVLGTVAAVAAGMGALIGALTGLATAS
jgi:hypothetical protein